MILSAKQVSEAPAIDLTPIIDMVFLLLIFFLVATTFHQTEREMKIALPVADASLPMSTLLRELVVNVDRDGRIVLNGRTVSAEEMRSTIAQAVTANPEQKVTVRGDREATYAHIVSALDICKSAGIQEPYLDTVPSK